MNANEVYEIIQNNRSNYNYFGLRSMTPNYYTNDDVTAKIGDMPRNSYHWDDGESTGVEINGVCALGIDMDDEPAKIEKVIESLKSYHGKQVVLIGSFGIDYGEDQGEIIMRNGETIIAVWSK